MQTELWIADAALQVLGCSEYLGLLSNAQRDGLLSCGMCATLEELCCQVEELQEEVSRLCSIREDEKGDRSGLLCDTAA